MYQEQEYNRNIIIQLHDSRLQLAWCRHVGCLLKFDTFQFLTKIHFHFLNEQHILSLSLCHFFLNSRSFSLYEKSPWIFTLTNKTLYVLTLLRLISHFTFYVHTLKKLNFRIYAVQNAHIKLVVFTHVWASSI